MRLRRTLAAGVAVAAVTAALTGCSGSSAGSSGKQTVSFWEFDTSAPTVTAYKKAIAAFEKKNPNIIVNMSLVPWATQQQKITTAIASGGLPDVSMMGNDVVAEYAAAGDLAPLNPYLSAWSKEEGKDISADMYAGDKSYYTYKGKLYGAPLADETRMVYYNKTLFTKAGLDPNSPPTTWAQMLSDAEALKKVTSVPWDAPMSNQYITVQTFMSVYLSYGAQLFNAQGKCGLQTPQFQSALNYYTGIAKAGLTSTDAANETSDTSDALFASGKAAMYINGPGLYATIKNQNPSLLKNVGIAEIPAGPKGQFGFLGGWPLVMWKGSKAPAAAAKWMHYVTSPSGALNQIAGVSGNLPGRKSLASVSPWNGTPFSDFSKQLTKAYPYQYPAGPSPKMGQIETTSIQTAVQQVATGSLSPAAATSQLCTTINGILAK